MSYKQNGFVLISLLLAISIIAVLALYFLNSKNESQNLQNTKAQSEKSIEQTSQNLNLYQEQINNQNSPEIQF